MKYAFLKAGAGTSETPIKRENLVGTQAARPTLILKHARNMPGSRSKGSKYKGVSWHKMSRQWIASYYCPVEKFNIILGRRFETDRKAAQAYTTRFYQDNPPPLGLPADLLNGEADRRDDNNGVLMMGRGASMGATPAVVVDVPHLQAAAPGSAVTASPAAPASAAPASTRLRALAAAPTAAADVLPATRAAAPLAFGASAAPPTPPPPDPTTKTAGLPAVHGSRAASTPETELADKIKALLEKLEGELKESKRKADDERKELRRRAEEARKVLIREAGTASFEAAKKATKQAEEEAKKASAAAAVDVDTEQREMTDITTAETETKKRKRDAEAELSELSAWEEKVTVLKAEVSDLGEMVKVQSAARELATKKAGAALEAKDKVDAKGKKEVQEKKAQEKACADALTQCFGEEAGGARAAPVCSPDVCYTFQKRE